MAISGFGHVWQMRGWFFFRFWVAFWKPRSRVHGFDFGDLDGRLRFREVIRSFLEFLIWVSNLWWWFRWWRVARVSVRMNPDGGDEEQMTGLRRFLGSQGTQMIFWV